MSLAMSVPETDARLFAIIATAGTGMYGEDSADHLIEHAKLAVMPGSLFGTAQNGKVRGALSVGDGICGKLCTKIAARAGGIMPEISP